MKRLDGSIDVLVGVGVADDQTGCENAAFDDLLQKQGSNGWDGFFSASRVP